MPGMRMSGNGLTGICGVCSEGLVAVVLGVEVNRAAVFFVPSIFHDPEEDGDEEFPQFPS